MLQLKLIKYNKIILKAENEKYEKGLLQLDPEIWKEKPKVFATLDSEQIKLADGSNTTFDGDNPDIRFDDGGRTLQNYILNLNKLSPSIGWGFFYFNNSYLYQKIKLCYHT